MSLYDRMKKELKEYGECIREKRWNQLWEKINCRQLVAIHFYSTLGFILLFVILPLSWLLGLFGAGDSMWLALCLCGFSESELCVRIGACWLFGYPVLLLLCYILSSGKKVYFPYWCMELIELAAILGMSVYELRIGNPGCLYSMIPNLLVGVLMLTLFTAKLVQPPQPRTTYRNLWEKQ